MEVLALTNYNRSFYRKTNVWFSCKDGNFSSHSTWISNGSRKHNYPQPGDNVIISHNVIIDIQVTVNNLYVNNSQATLSHPVSTNLTLTVNGDFQCQGTYDQSATSGTVNTLILNGYNNYIANYLIGTTSNITYAGTFDQQILPLTYGYLTIAGNGTKTPNGVITVNNNLVVFGTNNSCTLDFGAYNFTVNGTSTCSGGGFKKSSSTGLVLFVGLCSVAVSNFWDFRGGNGNVEFRGGWKTGNDDNGYFFTGTGTYTFSTNNQSVTRNYPYVTWSTMYCNIVIAGITLTLGDATYQQFWQLAGSSGSGCEGTNSSSQLVQYNSKVVQTNTISPMSVYGTYNLSVSGLLYAEVGYNIATNYTIPNQYFPSVCLYGSGLGSLNASMVVNGNLNTQNTTGKFELGNYNLTVNGNLSIGTLPFLGYTLSKYGPGSILVTGTSLFDINSPVKFTGNPTIEFRGNVTIAGSGYAIGGYTNQTTNFGNGLISFTTSSAIVLQNKYVSNTEFGNNILIGSGVTLTIQQNVGVNADFMFDGYLNGTDGTSALIVNSGQTIRMNNASYPVPMTTGTLTNNGNMGYVFNGNYTVPLGSYNVLYIGGTGTKTLGQNTTVTGLQILAGGTLEFSSYNFSNSGTTTLYSSGLGTTLSKNSATGTTSFTGLVNIQNNCVFNLTGNPNVTFGGGITFGATSTSNFGTGTMKFTGNQSITGLSGYNNTISNILIDSASTLTINTTNTTIAAVSLNGVDSTSILLNGGNITYSGSSVPMVTGKLYCNTTTPNTFTYNASGAQNIQVPTDATNPGYYNLTLTGSGAKSLTGNTNYYGTYILSGTATLTTGGYTLTFI